MKGFDAAALEDMLALLHDEKLIKFVQEHLHEYRYRDEFLEEPMPQGVDPAFLWELVSFVRRMTGRPTVRELGEGSDAQPIGNQSFWTATPDMIARLNDIVSRSNPSSHLSLSLARMGSRPAVQQLVLEELEAAAYRDGVGIEREQLREVVFDGRVPEAPEEQLFANMRALMDELETLARKPASVELFLAMHERLAEGTQMLRAEANLSPTPKAAVVIRSQDELFASIVRGCENPCAWGPHPLFGILLNADTAWVTPSFSHFNGLMELPIRWRSYHAIGVPALCWVPLSKMRLDWERQLVGPPEVPMRYGEALVTSSFGVDSTPYSQQIVRFLDAGLDRLERIVARIEKADTRCKQAVAQDGRLTLRQKQLLADLVDDPSRVIDVGSYKRRFDIAASTARGDLTHLVSLNYLLTEFSAKKQVFRLRPSLALDLANHKAVSTPASNA